MSLEVIAAPRELTDGSIVRSVSDGKFGTFEGWNGSAWVPIEGGCSAFVTDGNTLSPAEIAARGIPAR